MKTRSLLTAASLLVLSRGYVAEGGTVGLVSQTHHVWGRAGGYDPATGWFANPYDCTGVAPVSGSASALFYVGENYWVTNTVSSQAGDFLVQATDGSRWIFTGSQATAQSTYVLALQANTNVLSLQFNGEVRMHAFENWVTFSLTDWTTRNPIDTRTWRTEQLPGDSGIVDAHYDYPCDPSHLYELVLSARVAIGDTPGVTSRLQARVTPEPAALSLLALCGLALVRRLRDRRSGGIV